MEISTIQETGRELRGGRVDHLAPAYTSTSLSPSGHPDPTARSGSHTMIPKSSSNPGLTNYSRSASKTSLSSKKRIAAAAAFTSPHASQKFTDQQKKTLAQFSSVNYSPTHSLVYKDWIQKHPPK